VTAGRSVAARRSRRRRPSLFVGSVLLLVVFYLLATFVDVWLASRSSFDGRAPAAVVLGAAQYNGEPSPVLRGRLDHAAGLYFDGSVDIIVVTGGGQDGDITTEAKASYDYLREVVGIPDEQLRLEVDGTSTYESLAATARFLDREGIDRIVLVTDPYHARRASLVAAEVGFSADVSITNTPSPFRRLLNETAAVAIGRLVGFRRLDRF
jgi:uncharacterized SAM-binding protein YcdF (DUF218 family)